MKEISYTRGTDPSVLNKLFHERISWLAEREELDQMRMSTGELLMVKARELVDRVGVFKLAALRADCTGPQRDNIVLPVESLPPWGQPPPEPAAAPAAVPRGVKFSQASVAHIMRPANVENVHYGP